MFVCILSDLFHENVYSIDRSRIDVEMNLSPQHHYVLCTKRPKIMAYWFDTYSVPNNWTLLTTAENQVRFDERWKYMREINAKNKGVSVEPMLGPVSICNSQSVRGPQDYPTQVVAGPETGPRRRPCGDVWMETLERECAILGIPFWDKRKGEGRRREWARPAIAHKANAPLYGRGTPRTVGEDVGQSKGVRQ